MRPAVVQQPFDRGDIVAGDCGDLARARLRRYAVNQHHAGAALLQAAPEAAAVQGKILAQDGEQRAGGIDLVEANALAVEGEFDAHDSCWKRAACSVTSPRTRQGCPGNDSLCHGACSAQPAQTGPFRLSRLRKEPSMRFRGSIFGRLLEPINRRQFQAAVDRLDADAYDKSFKSWDHLVALIYAQLSGASGL